MTDNNHSNLHETVKISNKFSHHGHADSSPQGNILHKGS